MINAKEAKEVAIKKQEKIQRDLEKAMPKLRTAVLNHIFTMIKSYAEDGLFNCTVDYIALNVLLVHYSYEQRQQVIKAAQEQLNLMKYETRHYPGTGSMSVSWSK